jgi:heat shock protein HtpX
MATQGKPRWYKPDAGLAARMVLTMFLLGLVYVVFAVVLAFLHVPWYLLVFGALVIAGFQLFFSDKIALASMKAQFVDEQEAPQLHDMVGRLAAQANLPKPKIAIVDTQIPNAFATGRDANHAVIAITTGLLSGSGLTQPEIEAVIAHELTHIINRDMLVMTIATFFSMIASHRAQLHLVVDVWRLWRWLSARRQQRQQRHVRADRAAGVGHHLRHQLHPDSRALALPRAGG